MRFSFNLFTVIYVLFFSQCFTEPVSYDGDQVWRLLTSHPRFSEIEEFLVNSELDIWSQNQDFIDFQVPKALVPTAKQKCLENDMSFQILIDDVQRLIKNERKTDGSSRADFTFDEYHPIEEIFAYLDELAETNDLVTSESIGTSFEGQEIKLVKISSQTSTSNPAIWMDCGIHAREWVSPATCLWGLDYLTSQYSSDPIITAFLDNHDIYMVPVLNLDGYNYTWTQDRLWRKNRSYYSGDSCTGVDLNRNYDDGHWGEVGASSSSCSDTYHGPSPFSELETTAVREKILSIQETTTVEAIFTLHSYGQLWLFAYGWTSELPPDSDEMYRVSQVGVDAIASVSGTSYTNGPHYTTIYPAAGTTVDWGYSEGVIHTYIVELRDQGHYGFLLPEDQIVPTATEAWTGFIAAINAI